jgi:hypothetical protein
MRLYMEENTREKERVKTGADREHPSASTG